MSWVSWEVENLARCSVNRKHWTADIVTTVTVHHKRTFLQWLLRKPEVPPTVTVEKRGVRSCEYAIYWFWFPEMARIAYTGWEGEVRDRLQMDVHAAQEREKFEADADAVLSGHKLRIAK
jgi:hypothetical protein